MFHWVKKIGTGFMLLGFLFLGIYATGSYIETSLNFERMGWLGFILTMLAALMFIIDYYIERFFYPYDD